LDITGAPRAETCWTTAIKEAISLSCIPDSLGTLPTLFKPSDIPAALIANALSRETIVSKTSVYVKASLAKVFKAAVKFSTV